MARVGRYVIAYLLGIAAAVAFTPAEMVLAGHALWHLYPVFAFPGVLAFYFYLSPQYSVGAGPVYWLTFCLGFTPVVVGVAASRSSGAWLRGWAHLWIGFPVGFVGTLGAYCTVAASI
jgi:hypothetical protein